MEEHGMLPAVPPPGMPKRPMVPAPASAPQPMPASGDLPAHLRPVPGKLARAKPAIPLTTKQKQVTPTEEVAFATVEVQMGGRQQMVSTLSTAQLPADVERVLSAIADPQNDKVSLARICAEADVSLAHLLKLFQAAALARGQLAAHLTIAHKLPDVAAAVMEDAVGGERMCQECLGATTVPDPTKEDPTRTKPCEKCRGRGTVTFRPDHEVQKTALKLGKLLDPGGIRVAVNQQTAIVAGGADSGSYDKLVSALDNQLYGSGRDRLTGPADQADVVDGEVEGDGHGRE